MTYERFAYVYDALMKEAPYGKWLRFFEQHAASLPGKDVLDLACGTGELSWRFAAAGWNTTGVDLSEDMLMIAQQKAVEKGLSIPVFQQDMRSLEGLGQFDAVTIFCDSLNYITEAEDVRRTFQHIQPHVKPGGLLLFDVHSLFKVHHIFKGHTFTETGEDISYIWDCFEGEQADSVEHELTFFVLDESTEQYERFDEYHVQRTFSPVQYAAWLQEAGFTDIQISADFTSEPPAEQSERIFFVCRKPVESNENEKG